MSNIKADIIFNNSGLDSDSSWEFITQGDSEYRSNVLVGEEGDNGLLTNMKGCHKGSISYPLTLSNVYQVVGSYYNRLTRKVYYFVFSQPYEGDLSDTYYYDNKLLEYTEDTGDLVCIFTDTGNYFGLHFNYFMKDCVMIGDWLYFNPKQSEPKMIDIQKAYLYEQATNNLNGYAIWDAATVYNYGDRVVYYGGVFLCEDTTVAGESPITTPAKWTRIADAYQNETGLGFTSEFEYAFNVLKMPPVSRPEVSFGSDTEIQSNNVRGKIFRFSYRYKYFDNSYSVYSSFSQPALHIQDEQWDGELTGDTTNNNYIGVIVSLHSAALVKEVEIVFQEIGQDWRRCKTVNRIEQAELDSVNFTYNFYNNESYPVVDGSVVLVIEDAVPQQARAQELINKNILTYGGVTEGFDNVPKDEIDVSLTPVLNPIDYTVTYGQLAVLRDNIANDDWVNDIDVTGGDVVYYRNIDLNDAIGVWGVTNGSAFGLTIDGTSRTKTFSAIETATTGDLVNAVVDFIKTFGSHLIVSEGPVLDRFVLVGKYGSFPNISISVFYTPSAEASLSLVKETGFKTGANHPFCLLYYDETLRRFEAQTSKDNPHGVGLEMLGTTVYVPLLSEVSSPAIDTANRWAIDWEVGHLPPSDAKYWRWGYAGNSLCSWFVQYIVENITDGTDTEASMSVIDITPLQTLKDTTDNTAGVEWNQFPQSNIDSYSWVKGDRVRIITYEVGIIAQAAPGTTLGSVVDSILDYEIIKQSDDGNSIYIQLIDESLENVGINSLIEIYRPLKSTTETHRVFYEFGPLMPIIEDSGGTLVHGGITQNQDSDLALPATGTFNNGDVYHIVRTPSKPLCLSAGESHIGAIHESMWWSDFYDSDDWDRGKPGVETNFGQRNLNIIRFSEQYLQNTQINGLSTFLGDNYKELNDIYGNIMAIMEVGNTLKVYQERKPSSILIGRQEYLDTEGNVTIATSNRVLGAIRYSTTNWGTEFPESIERNNRYVYGFDIYNGVVWRDSANGIFPISGKYEEAGAVADYKMASYFKAKSKALLASGIENTKVLTVWDEEYKLLYIAFKDMVDDANNDVAVFHEPSNRWITFAELESTEHDGYNVIIELTYDIIQGFSAGIGYEFDEATRFAIFNVVTSAGLVGYWSSLLELEIEPLAPSLNISNGGETDGTSMGLTLYEPTVEITWLYGDESSMAFAYDDDDITDAGEYQQVQVSVSDSVEPFTVDVTEVTWMEYRVMAADGVTNITGTPALWLSGCFVRFCPYNTNGGGEKTGNAYIGGSGVASWGISMTQQAAPASVTVRAGNDSILSVSDTGGNVIGGLYIEFTPHYVPTPVDPHFDVCWLIKVNDVEAYSSLTSGIACTQDTHKNLISIAYGSATWVDGDVIDVYLYYEEAPALS